MCQMISCLVNKEARVYAKDGVHSHTQLAVIFKVNEDRCLKYEFQLNTRTLFQDFKMDLAPFEAKQSHDRAAQEFFDECAGTPEKLMAYVRRGNWAGDILPSLLTDSARVEYNKACAAAVAEYGKVWAAAEAEYGKAYDAAWAEYNKACTAAWAEYDKARDAAWAECDKAWDAAKAERDKACVETWLRIFKNPKNRIGVWKK